MFDETKKAIVRAARLFGLPADWLLAVAYVESKINPKAKNKSTGAAGLFQFVPSTAREYNIDPYNVPEACAAAAMMMAKNKRALEAKGLEASLTACYLCHQQGLFGYQQIELALRGKDVLSESRLRNMRNNIIGMVLKDEFDDQQKAAIFILFWQGRLGQAQVQVRK